MTTPEEWTDNLQPTERGANGFGSSDTNPPMNQHLPPQLSNVDENAIPNIFLSPNAHGPSIVVE